MIPTLIEEIGDGIYVGVDILEMFADAQRLKFNGHNVTKEHDDNWSGSWDNAVTRIESV